MGYSKSIACATRGCPHEFDVVADRFGRDIETARCPTCYSETRMVFDGGSLEHKELV